MPSPQSRTEAPEGRNLFETIAETIGERIIRGQLEPGARVLEVQIADELGVSRGPVREALRLLEKRRLVEILPRRGAQVTRMGMREVDRLYDVIIPLYQLLTEKTAENWTPDNLPPIYSVIEALIGAADRGEVGSYYEHNFAFAHACAPVADNPLLDELFRDLEPAQRRVLYLCWDQRAAGMDEHLGLMRAMIRAVTERDVPAARQRIGDIGELERSLARAALGAVD